jgi:uncharacterized protein GlcG (DUF336 family)
MKALGFTLAAVAVLAAANVQAQPVAGQAAPSAPYNGPASGPRPGDAPQTGPRPPHVPDVVARGPGIDLALEAAKVAVAACVPFHVGVSILDSAGLPKLYYIPDGTAGKHAYTAFRKATTAMLVQGPSETIVDKVKTDPQIAAAATASTNYITYAGGLPIMDGGQMIGAIGVSGAEPSAKDEECAAKGLAQVQDRLR